MAKKTLAIMPDALAAMINEAVRQLIELYTLDKAHPSSMSMELSQDLLLSDPDFCVVQEQGQEAGVVSLEAFASTKCPGVISLDDFLEAVTLPDYVSAMQMAREAGYEFWVEALWSTLIDQSLQTQIASYTDEQKRDLVMSMVASRFDVILAPIEVSELENLASVDSLPLKRKEFKSELVTNT